MNTNHNLSPGLNLQADEGNDAPVLLMVERDDTNVGPTALPLHRPRFAPYTTTEFGLFPEAECAIEGVLPAQGIACAFGPAGVGKSVLMASMIHSLGTGQPWFGREVTPCVVWSVVLEGHAGQRNRMLAIEKHVGQRLPKTTKFVFNDLRLTQPEDVAELADRIRKNGGADVIFIDTLACAMAGGDENSSRDMGLAIAGAKELQRATEGLVVLVHHTGKDASRGLRGHSSLNAALDACIEVKRHEDYRSWKLVKSRDSEDGVQGAFLLEPVEVRIDSKGRPVNSIVVVPTDLPEEPERANAPAHKNQSIALTCLQAHFEMQEVAEDSDMVSIDRTVAIEVVKEVMDAGPRHRKQRAAEAIDGLVKGGFLVEIGGQLSLPADAEDD
ncbi:AAA family ATPase [Variovorax sp. CCNWLW186]|uniref:AAA family ATPase n=1 Tax=Variovorax sp. CCNWLW186 TaxID=3127473 RepID=UPI003076E219